MYLTREADYAVRCVLFLSREADRIASAGEISKAGLIPKGFLAKILQRLAKRGIVRSTKGAAGGFALSKPPEEVCVLDVIEALQGPFAINACAVDENACDLSAACAVHPVWVELRQGIEERLKEETFAKLIKREKGGLTRVRKAR
ncbi:MAG: Rrf2 family transcriptional regulator [Syntrophorhabdales bacterium]|jgi:Rrf2 family protein